MGIIEDAKKTCPICSSPNMKRAKIVEDDIEKSGYICVVCGWNGENKNE